VRRRRPVEDDGEEEPRPRRKKEAGGKGLLIGLLVGGGVVLVGGVVLISCLSVGDRKFTPEKFRTVRAGMTDQEVIDLLGRPSAAVDAGNALFGSKTLRWSTSRGQYTIVLLNGKVMMTASSDPDGIAVGGDAGAVNLPFGPMPGRPGGVA